MSTEENISTKEYELVPVPIRPKKYYLEIPYVYPILIFGMATLFTGISFLGGGIDGLIISMPLFLVGGYWLLKEKKREHRAVYLESYSFPPTIKNGVRKQYPFLSDEELALVLQGLRQYFQLWDLAGNGMVAMPSRVVDVAWHEFILTTRLYEEFCNNGIGRFLHHTPAAAAETSQEIKDGWKEAWRVACEWEEIDQKLPSRLPFLFALDSALDIPNGFKHSLDNDYAAGETLRNDSCDCGG